MLDNAVRFGGTLTINWHDRSLAPERLWGEFYSDLIQDLKNRGAWFCNRRTGDCLVSKTPVGEFETDSTAPGAVRAQGCG